MRWPWMFALALCGGFTPLSCFWYIYVWPESLPCLLWCVYIKWDPCLCSRALSASIRNVQTVAGNFSTVCSSSTHIFHLLWKFNFQHLGAGSSFFLLFIYVEGKRARQKSVGIMMLYSLWHLKYLPNCNNILIPKCLKGLVLDRHLKHF